MMPLIEVGAILEGQDELGRHRSGAMTAWLDLLPAMDPQEVADALGLRGAELLSQRLDAMGRPQLSVAEMHRVLAEVLEAVHGADPMRLIGD